MRFERITQGGLDVVGSGGPPCEAFVAVVGDRAVSGHRGVAIAPCREQDREE